MEHFLEESAPVNWVWVNVPISRQSNSMKEMFPYNLNEETLVISQRRSAFNAVNDWAHKGRLSQSQLSPVIYIVWKKSPPPTMHHTAHTGPATHHCGAPT